MNQASFRITAEAATEPNRQWIRLALDARDLSVEAINSMAANLRGPVAICDPENICDIPERGQPARGWIEELEKRDTLFGYELWAKASWIDIEYAQACASGSLWCRTIVDRNALDPISGYPIGTKLMRVELCASPFPQTLTRGIQASNCNERKKSETMTTANTNVTTLLAALPRYRKDSPNDCIALERAARELIPEAKNMAHQDLYRDIVHPAVVALGAQKFSTASSRAGATVRASTVGTAPSGAATATRQRLDVGGYDGVTKFAKLMSYARSLNPTMAHDALFTLACDLNRTHEVVIA